MMELSKLYTQLTSEEQSEINGGHEKSGVNRWNDAIAGLGTIVEGMISGYYHN